MVLLPETKAAVEALVASAPAAFIASVNAHGFPQMKAMLPPRKREGLLAFYFTTNTSSMRVTQYLANPKAAVYFCDAENFKAVMLEGMMVVLEDPASREMIWSPADTRYYPGGVTDPDYCVLKFVTIAGRYYENLSSVAFTARNLA